MKKDPSIDAAGSHAVAALLALAVEDLPLKDRIRKAWVDHLALVDYERLSPPFKKRFDHMRNALNREEFLSDAVEGLDPKEAEDLANRMVYFALDLEGMK